MSHNGQSAQVNNESSPASHQAETRNSVQPEKDAESLASARLRALRALQGSLADIPVTSDDFARMKQEMIEQEERAIARRS